MSKVPLNLDAGLTSGCWLPAGITTCRARAARADRGLARSGQLGNPLLSAVSAEGKQSRPKEDSGGKPWPMEEAGGVRGYVAHKKQPLSS